MILSDYKMKLVLVVISCNRISQNVYFQALQLLDMWESHVGEEHATPSRMIAVLQEMPLTQDIIDKIKKSCSDC